MHQVKPEFDTPITTGRVCWCGGESSRFLFPLNLPELPAVVVRKCEGCGVVYLDPQPTVDQLAPYYDTPYYGQSREKFVGPIARFVRHWQAGRARSVASRLSSGSSILDVGCGNGQFLMDMHSMGFHVAGTELSTASAARVPKAIAGNIHVGQLTQLKLPAGQFDAITLWHVLEHLADPYVACQEIHRLLKPDGWLFISVPNAQSPEADLFGRHWFHLDPPRHLFGLGHLSLPALLTQYGFEVHAISTWSLEQNPYGFMQSVLNAMGFERDRAYNTLKAQPRPLTDKVVDLVLLSLLTGPGLVWSSVLSLIGRGSTMTLIARKKN